MDTDPSSATALPQLELDFHAELLRPEDLLHLLVDGHNLRLRPDEGDGPFLTVNDPSKPAYLRFTFPPQTIAESAFFEAAIVPGGDPIPPAGDPGRKDPEEKSRVREPFPKPGFPAKKARRTALIGHRSRLVFHVSAETRIPYSMEGLLNWSGLDLSVNGIAAIPRLPTAAQIASAPEIKEPAITETSIELPWPVDFADGPSGVAASLPAVHVARTD